MKSLLYLLASGALANADPFPIDGLLPKQETGTQQIRSAHPDYDGRGIRIAVFDSGIDPGARGLQRTSDNQPKIIDLIDATGSGDVDTSQTATIEEGFVTGLSGRKLSVPPAWKGTHQHVQIGLKSGYELFPSNLVSRLREERRERFLRAHTQLRAEVSLATGLAATERTARLDALDATLQDYHDPGPVFDCVVYAEDDRWYACIDTDEDGDLADETALCNYGIGGRFASFGDATQLNFAVNIYKAGTLLSIVVPANMHGTHVAGILGGHDPERPELNGLAPGAQLVSVKIGDTRLDGMETGSAILRGLNVAQAHGCHLINMSYGEPTRLPNRGRIISEIDRMVHDADIVFVASAGNAGPALGTVGAPGGTSAAVIGVGAYVTPAMMRAGYALRQSRPDLAYTWSSRGPATDGDWGVSICAPGGALAPVPNYTLRWNRYANGTSMSSPNACGSLAVLLGALRAEAIPYSARSVKRVIENTAQPLPDEDVFTQGHGLLRVDRALALFREQNIAEEPRYQLSLPERNAARGLYLRETDEAHTPQSITVAVSPQFSRSASNAEKLDFNRRLQLISTVPWLHCPESLFLTHKDTRFAIDFDPAPLALAGASARLHAGEIQALDPAAPGAGPVFRLPATVVVPQSWSAQAHAQWKRSGKLGGGEIQRAFFETPAGASWAEITWTNRSARQHAVVLHAMQTLPQRRHSESGLRLRLDTPPGIPTTRRVAVTPGYTLELVTASNWSNQEAMEYEVALQFRGLTADTDMRILSAGQPVVRVDLRSLYRDEPCQPRASFSHWRTPLQPASSTVRALGNGDPRDTSPTGPVRHAARVSYPFSLTASAEIVPRFPSHNHRLYEADVQWQLFTIGDRNGQRRHVDDGWEPHAITLEKGDYQIDYQWSHPDPAVLEALAKMPLTLEGKLASAVTLGLHATRRDALQRQNSLNRVGLRAGEIQPLHIAVPLPEKFPKLPIAARQLFGRLTLHPDAPQSAVDLLYALPFPDAVAEVPASAAKAVLKARLRRLLAREEWESFDRELAAYRQAYPDDLSGAVLELHRKDSVENRRTAHESLVALCDAILGRIDHAALAQHRGRRALADEAERATVFAEQFEILTDTLYRKCRAIAYHDGQHEKAGESYDPEPFEAAFQELRSWVDTKQADYVLAHIRWHRRHGQFGQALQLLNRHMEEAPPTRLLHDKRVTILRRLGWTLWAEHEAQWNRRRFLGTDSEP